MARNDQSDLFGGRQSDFSGAERAPAYLPDPTHVRNRLAALVGAMQASATWPWEPAVVRLHRERTFAYLCGLLPDAGEAAEWQRRIEAEVARLDAGA